MSDDYAVVCLQPLTVVRFVTGKTFRIADGNPEYRRDEAVMPTAIPTITLMSGSGLDLASPALAH